MISFADAHDNNIHKKLAWFNTHILFFPIACSISSTNLDNGIYIAVIFPGLAAQTKFLPRRFVYSHQPRTELRILTRYAPNSHSQ
jgi:hypothetical protein